MFSKLQETLKRLDSKDVAKFADGFHEYLRDQADQAFEVSKKPLTTNLKDIIYSAIDDLELVDFGSKEHGEAVRDMSVMVLNATGYGAPLH